MIRAIAAVFFVSLLPFHALAAPPSALVRTTEAKQQSLHPQVRAYGTVAADPDYVTTVAIPRDGIVVAVSVRAGQVVQVGDPLATIETAPGAAARYQQAKSAVAYARKDLAHIRSLYDQHLATKSQLANAQKSLADAKAKLSAERKVGAGQDKEVLRANAPGIVNSVKASPGDRITANAIIASIVTRDRLLLNLGLEPEDALQIAVGAKVTMRAPQSDTISFVGEIQSVNAMMDPKSRLVNAVVGIPPKIANRLILGMTLEGEIDLPMKSGISVPRGALMSDKQGTYVFVVKNGVAHRHNVKVTLENDKVALIQSDVVSGDKVIVSGNAGVNDGTHIRVQ